MGAGGMVMTHEAGLGQVMPLVAGARMGMVVCDNNFNIHDLKIENNQFYDFDHKLIGDRRYGFRRNLFLKQQARSFS